MRRIVNALGIVNWGKRAGAVLALCATATITLPAQTFTTLHSFCAQSGCADGKNPDWLVQAIDGNLYAATSAGGAGYGTIFKITPNGKLTTLFNFDSTDGSRPYGRLVQIANGDLYGTTYEGGADFTGEYLAGTVFKITPGGTLTTLHNFAGYPTDGSFPIAGLVLGTNGDLYGTTYVGGASTYSPCLYLDTGGIAGCGTVFKITPSGTLTTLYNFCSQSGCTDGWSPEAPLVQAANGDLYGTTLNGGTGYSGTVFKITPSGMLTTLYNFCSQTNCTDGANPYLGNLVQATNGDLYGTTYDGGANNYGTVFKITPSGALATIYSFCSQTNCTDGANPVAGLIQATDGDLYGTTYLGGANGNYGTIFKIAPNGTLTTLYSFCSQSGCEDGEAPGGGPLLQDTNGTFYGTTSYGGANGAGTVFRFSVGLGPFVETQTTSGKVGAAVKILGTDLTGATSVTFNGTPQPAFTVNSTGTAISSTVPVGATTGTVQVVTPSGTLLSNVPFRVP